MIVIGIDPGTRDSAYVMWDGSKILQKSILANEVLLRDVRAEFFGPPGMVYVVEGMQYFGKAVGKDVFQTCYFIGRIMEATPHPVELVYRKDIKLWLTGTVKSRDKDIRAALIDMLGKDVTHGVSSHLWSALAVAVFYYETMVEKENLKKREIN
jgi:hypothetical protein